MNRKFTQMTTYTISFMIVLCTIPSVKADLIIEKFNPAIGDYWNYSVIMSPYNGSLDIAVLGIQDITVNGTTYHTYLFNTNWNYTIDFGSSISRNSGSDNEYYNITDYALIKEISHTDERVISGALPFNTTTDCTVEYQPPLRRLDFPILFPKNWSTMSLKNSTCSSIINGDYKGPSNNSYILSYSSSAISISNVTVPSGTFKTIQLKSKVSFNFGNTTYLVTEYYSPVVGGAVMIETSEPFEVLTSYKYSGLNSEPSTSITIFGLSIEVFALLLLVMIIVILIVISPFIIRRKRNKIRIQVEKHNF